MIHNLWRCFETTGAIDTYLSYKDYERDRNTYTNSIVQEEVLGEDVDGMSDT